MTNETTIRERTRATEDVAVSVSASDQLTHAAPTTGPWYMGEDEDGDAYAAIIATGNGVVARVDSDFCSDTEMHANARLIAAAPDLYEALKAIQAQCAGHADEFSRNVWQIANAALKKAQEP